MTDPNPVPASLAFENVSWGNGILRPVTFKLQPGRVLGVLGPNGAGKSTLLRLIYRFNTPATGRVLIDGKSVHALPPRQVAKSVAAVLQEQPTDFAMTVTEIVLLGRLPHRSGLSSLSQRDHNLAELAIDRLGLRKLADRSMATLSGGERQRVMVARALAQEPGLIVVDEPTNHLDIRHQLQVLSLLRSLGITVVASLHDLNLVHGFADDLVVLRNGQALACGKAAKVLTPELISHAFNVNAVPRGPAQFDFSLRDDMQPEALA